MGLFGPKKKICPQHGTYVPGMCDHRCRAQINAAHQPRQEDPEPEESTPDPSNGWW